MEHPCGMMSTVRVFLLGECMEKTEALQQWIEGKEGSEGLLLSFYVSDGNAFFAWSLSILGKKKNLENGSSHFSFPLGK